jgi:hypothetical protein
MKISKLASKRTMRVATMFTGVAASAAAFTPFAPAAHASIQENIGCDNVPHWFHIYADHLPGVYSDCFGYSEQHAYEGISAVKGFCGGTNYGSFSTITDFGKGNFQHGTFGPGTTIYWFSKAHLYGSKDVLFESLTISRWAGNDDCSQPYQQ